MNRQTGVTGFYEVNNLDRSIKLNIIAKFQDHALAHKRRIKCYKRSAMSRSDFCKLAFTQEFLQQPQLFPGCSQICRNPCTLLSNSTQYKMDPVDPYKCK